MQQMGCTGDYGVRLSRTRHENGLTSLNGGVQLAQAGSDFSVHLPLARRVLRKGVAIGIVGLAYLQHPGAEYSIARQHSSFLLVWYVQRHLSIM